MSLKEPETPSQSCPACGTLVDLGAEEPLARATCPQCGEKIRVERAFDNFVLLETLGVGGMGSVYKARDTRLDRLVALKLLRKELSDDPAEAARLQQEARATAAVNHPNVIQVYSSGSDHGQFYLVMELVDHGSLDDLMEQEKRVPEERALETAMQVARGLQAACEKGLIHRDVKPANILFADEGTAKIGDFGLAVVAEQKAEARNEIWGTPYYVAPERLNNEPEDFRSDIYSLGATLFHAIAGRPSIEGETNSASALRQLKNEPIDLGMHAPEVSGETRRIINRMLAPEPAQRFASYDELIEQLQQAHRALSDGDGKRKDASNWRGWKLFAALAALLALFLGGGYFFATKVSPRSAAVENQATSPSDRSAALTQQYEDARRQLLAGKYDAASSVFARLAAETPNAQPLLNWIRLHRGLAALLGGQPAQAKEAFSEVERAGPFSMARGDAALARFFVETAKSAAASGAITAPVSSSRETSSVQPFSLFLFAAKNWQLSAFPAASALFEQFLASQPSGKFAWINDYKPLARKYVDDYKRYAAWKAIPQRSTTSGEINAALSGLREVLQKVQSKTALSGALQAEEAKLTAQLSAREKTENELREQERKKVLERETPLWEAARAGYRSRIALYDFAGAQAAISAPALTDSSLKEERAAAEKKARWLIDWKEKLIADINRAGFAGPVTDIAGTEYKAPIVRATAARMTLKLPPYGTAEIDWTKLSPKMLLTISRAFIQPNAPDAADRKWLCAVFASETGQGEEARALSGEAAKAKPEYRDQLRLILSSP